MSKIHNPFGVACICLLFLFFPTLGILVSLRDRRILRKQQLARIFPPKNYREVDHVHEIDFHRSGVVVTDAGAVFARCCLAGCEEGIFIGKNMAAAWKILPPEPAHTAADLFLGRARW